MALEKYNQKRNFGNTPEPEGKVGSKGEYRFVVQRHDASRLHYDFRLELGGVLKSWAVPKGPSLNPQDKRLAMMVEDHPVSYIDFEGRIPEGNYGAGTVIVWDHGTFHPVDKDHKEISESAALAGIENGELKFAVNGKKLKGEFVFVQLKKADKGDAWLLIKHRDQFAQDSYDSENDLTASQMKQIEKDKKADAGASSSASRPKTNAGAPVKKKSAPKPTKS